MESSKLFTILPWTETIRIIMKNFHNFLSSYRTLGLLALGLCHRVRSLFLKTVFTSFSFLEKEFKTSFISCSSGQHQKSVSPVHQHENSGFLLEGGQGGALQNDLCLSKVPPQNNRKNHRDTNILFKNNDLLFLSPLKFFLAESQSSHTTCYTWNLPKSHRFLLIIDISMYEKKRLKYDK